MGIERRIVRIATDSMTALQKSRIRYASSTMPFPIDPIEAGQVSYGLLKVVRNYWVSQKPIVKVLQGLASNEKLTRIFVRDFVIPPGNPLISMDRGGVGQVPNVHELWPRVEGIAMADLLNLMGQAGKTKNIEIVEMSKDPGLWDSDMVVLGAQAQKCLDFYNQMKNVAYRMDPELRDNATSALVNKDPGYGYGIILKCQNPRREGAHGFLMGGYGVLGTEAAGFYFQRHCADLGRRFGKKCFGVVIRASVTAGVGSVERIEALDKIF